MLTECPHCGKRLKIEDALAGQQRLCPACQSVFTVPPTPAGQSSPGGTGTKPVPSEPEPGVPGATAAGTRATPPPLPASARRRPGPAPAGREGAGRALDTLEARGVLEGVLSALSGTMSLTKLAFFAAGAAATALVVACLLWAAGRANPSVAAVILFLGLVGAAGMLFGVLPGGLAYLEHARRQGRPTGMADAIGFCGRRFHSLFGAVLLWLAAFAVLNGLMSLLNTSGEAASFVAALLFLPQFAVNLLLAVAVLLGVLLPCAIAVEGRGVFAAVPLVVRLVRHRTLQVLLHVVLTLFLLSILTTLTAGLGQLALLPTAATNSPSATGLPGLAHLGELLTAPVGAGMGTAGSMGTGSGGDLIRVVSLAIAALMLASLPAVYWVVSFTGYYDRFRLSGRD